MAQESFNLFSVFTLLGGLALFLYGMNIMGSGLEKLAGSRMESVLRSLTSNTGKAVLLGAAFTAVIQSSSGTTVIVVGLVNSGIMKLSQAIGVIMGANIGTTITGQIIRLSDIESGNIFLKLLKPSSFAPVIAFVGAVIFVFKKKPKARNIGQILIGFGILFIGMQIMSESVKPLRESELFASLFTGLQNPFLGVLAGTLVTVAIQSSSASLGILQALSTTGLVTWSAAIPIILGQNIGTTSTPMIASIGASKAAKRAAYAHFYFNIIGTAIFMAAIYGIKAAIGLDFWDETMNMGDIANFHTLFNVVVTLLFIPFTGLLAKLATATVRDTPEDEANKLEQMPVLDDRLITSPAVAINQAKKATELMARNARENYNACIPVLFNYNEETLEMIRQREDMVDKLEVYISNYLVRIADREMNEHESHLVTELLYYIVEYERIGDYANGIASRSGEIFDKELEFSETAQNELRLLHEALNEIMDITLAAFTADDIKLAEQVEPLEETIDAMVETLRLRHICRLKNGTCEIETGTIFLEILTNLERVSDHCSNIAARIIGSSREGHTDAHALRRELHSGIIGNYNELLEENKKKYLDTLEKIVDSQDQCKVKKGKGKNKKDKNKKDKNK